MRNLHDKWYERSFGEDYLLVYKHRSYEKAAHEIANIIKWLSLSPQDIILDLCCGTGRHSIALAQQGLNIVGMDLSEVLLRQAVDYARNEAQIAIPFVAGDMRRTPFIDQSFSKIINMFTSFGYFDDVDNELVLREIQRLLIPDGRFLMDYLNPVYVKAHLVPESRRMEGNIEITEMRWLEKKHVCKKITLSEGNNTREYLERLRLYTIEEMVQMLQRSDLEVNSVYGNFNGGPYHTGSERMIIVGTK